jgi:hypothetical protein
MDFLSDNRILFFLLTGTLLSFFFAAKPTLLLWFSTIFTLIFGGFVGYFFPSLKIVWWVAYGASALLYIPALLFLTQKAPEKFPALSTSVNIYTLLFVATSLISSIASNTPLPQLAAASKSLFMLGGLWAFIMAGRLSEQTIIHWLKGLIIIGVIQFIPVMYQFIVVRSWRVAHTSFQVESADAVVGTFGGSQTGGGLGAVLVFYLIVCIVVLLAMQKYKVFSWRNKWWVYVLLGLPILFTEVKAAFIYLPVGIFFLYRRYIYQRPIKFTLGSILICLIIIGMLFSLQTIHLSTRGDDWRDNLQKAFSYSFQSQTQFGKITDFKFSRISAVRFWWQEQDADHPVNILIGHGLGSSRTQGQVLGSKAARYAETKIDLTGLSALLWDVGLVGVTLLYAILMTLFLLAGKLSRSHNLLAWQQALAGGLQATIPLIALSIPYRNDIPYAAPMMFTVMAIFGLIGWLNKQNIGTSTSKFS